MQNTRNMDKLFRSWIIALTFGSIIGIALLMAGLVPAFKSKGLPTLSDMFLCLVAGLIVTVCGQHWIRILNGKIFFKKSQTVALNGGEVAIPVPAGPFELWMFCKVPFAQYNGLVSIAINGGNTYIIKVPRRNPFLYPVRSNLAPIIWRLPHVELNAQGQCSIKFNLSSSFAETGYDRRVHKNNEESVSVLIKTPRCVTRDLHTASPPL